MELPHHGIVTYKGRQITLVAARLKIRRVSVAVRIQCRVFELKIKSKYHWGEARTDS